MTQISRLIEDIVSLAIKTTGEVDIDPAPSGGGGFADYALISLHCLRIRSKKSYRDFIDHLSEMPQITAAIGLETSDLPAPSTLCKAFDRLDMRVCRVLLAHSAGLHELSTHAAVDATFYERKAASRHYRSRTAYAIKTLKVTKLVDTATQAILDVHITTTRKGSDPDRCLLLARRNASKLESLAADKGYDKNSLRENLRELGIRPLIKHHLHAPYDHAHNARLDDDLYGQRAMVETVNSAVKRLVGDAVRARSWYRQFRELTLKCVIYNIDRANKG